MIIQQILIDHEYQSGFDTNCICGRPGIWYWEDWVAHVTPILQEQQ